MLLSLSMFTRNNFYVLFSYLDVVLLFCLFGCVLLGVFLSFFLFCCCPVVLFGVGVGCWFCCYCYRYKKIPLVHISQQNFRENKTVSFQFYHPP